MTQVEFNTPKGIGRTSRYRTNHHQNYSKKKKRSHQSVRLNTRNHATMTELRISFQNAGSPLPKFQIISSSRRRFIAKFSETGQPRADRLRRREDGAGELTDSSGSTSRERICSSAVITVTFISPPPVGIELAEGETEGEKWGVAGERSRAGVHRVSKVGAFGLTARGVCLESWQAKNPRFIFI